MTDRKRPPLSHLAPPSRTQDIGDTPPRLRNPDLARPAEQVGRPRATHLPGGSVASNGYWIHDQFGPRHYIGADVVVPEGRSPEELIEMIEERLETMAGLDASRVHVSFDGDVLRLAGSVRDAQARRRVGACATALAASQDWGLRVENCVTIEAAEVHHGH